MSDTLIVVLSYLGCYGLIVGYAAYLHLRLRKTAE
jgi:hypothetical protein